MKDDADNRTAELQLEPEKKPARRRRRVVADNVQPSNELGAWRCGLCGFRGFWRGGVHCVPAPDRDKHRRS